MKTVILCGGQGTRIRDVAENMPKPMISIGKRPILWHIMNHYAYYNIKEFVLCLGHLGWEIKNYFLNYNNLVSDFTINLGEKKITSSANNSNDIIDWTITMVETGVNSHTGARVKRIRKYVENDELFLLTYGDGLSNVNIMKLIEFHKSHNKIGTVTGVRPAGRFGEIEASNDNKILEFNEKPQVASGRINGGFFVFDSKRIWDYLNDDEYLSLEREPLQGLAKDGELMMFPHDGFWQPMDTHREYILLNNIWKEKSQKNESPWPGQITLQD